MWFTMNQENVSEWSDISTCRLCQSISALKKIQLSMLVSYKADIISLKCNFYYPWLSWQIAHLGATEHLHCHIYTYRFTEDHDCIKQVMIFIYFTNTKCYIKGLKYFLLWWSTEIVLLTPLCVVYINFKLSSQFKRITMYTYFNCRQILVLNTP